MTSQTLSLQLVEPGTEHETCRETRCTALVKKRKNAYKFIDIYIYIMYYIILYYIILNYITLHYIILYHILYLCNMYTFTEKNGTSVDSVLFFQGVM